MKCAKSVKVKYSASAAGSTGTFDRPRWRAASSATTRGEAEPTWWTCSSALGIPAMNASMPPWPLGFPIRLPSGWTTVVPYFLYARTDRCWQG